MPLHPFPDDLDEDDEGEGYPHPIVQAVTRALLAGRESRAAVAERIASTLGDGEPWMLELAGLWMRDGPGSEARITWWLSSFAPLLAWMERNEDAQPAVRWERRPVPLSVEGLPALETAGDLAAWLGWSADVLDGHADRNHWHRGQPRFRDYLYRWHGARLIEAPKDRLKRAQRQILDGILVHVPTHPCAHGFVRGRSVHSHARLHAGTPWVARLDLRCFFGSIAAPRVYGLFRTLGYSRAVASLLAGLTTTWTPAEVSSGVARRGPRKRPSDGRGGCSAEQVVEFPWNMPHLPQGAPTSPALANAIAWRLDRRLHGLAVAEGLTYSRYADDLTFSGARPRRAFLSLVERIVREEDFTLAEQKTRLRSQAAQQRVTGLVVNAEPGVSRAQRDRIRALIHRAERQGWAAVQIEGVQDAEAWVRGWVSWIEAANPRHGAPLRARLDALGG